MARIREEFERNSRGIPAKSRAILADSAADFGGVSADFGRASAGPSSLRRGLDHLIKFLHKSGILLLCDEEIKCVQILSASAFYIVRETETET